MRNQTIEFIKIIQFKNNINTELYSISIISYIPQLNNQKLVKMNRGKKGLGKGGKGTSSANNKLS